MEQRYLPRNLFSYLFFLVGFVLPVLILSLAIYFFAKMPTTVYTGVFALMVGFVMVSFGYATLKVLFSVQLLMDDKRILYEGIPWILAGRHRGLPERQKTEVVFSQIESYRVWKRPGSEWLEFRMKDRTQKRFSLLFISRNYLQEILQEIARHSSGTLEKTSIRVLEIHKPYSKSKDQWSAILKSLLILILPFGLPTVFQYKDLFAGLSPHSSIAFLLAVLAGVLFDFAIWRWDLLPGIVPSKRIGLIRWLLVAIALGSGSLILSVLFL